jgi:hypothetical protein
MLLICLAHSPLATAGAFTAAPVIKPRVAGQAQPVAEMFVYERPGLAPKLSCEVQLYSFFSEWRSLQVEVTLTYLTKV